LARTRGRRAAVTEPLTGSAHPVRGLGGGGLPWQLDSARGELRADGRLEVTVRGLVLARRDPVPPPMQVRTRSRSSGAR
jgi:hypothetical protein